VTWQLLVAEGEGGGSPCVYLLIFLAADFCWLINFVFVGVGYIRAKRVMLVVPLMSSSVSILVLCCSCVSFITSNRNVREQRNHFLKGKNWKIPRFSDFHLENASPVLIPM
jgi:hypothetical protein